MNGFSHKPARVVRRAYLASTRQHQQENENPAAKAKEKEFLSCQCQSNSETTNWPKAENLGQIER